MEFSNEELKQLQSLGTEMLWAFIDVCDKLKLRYYVAYGTLLGAVRHEGFIPWDDDVDVVMPRADYEVFLEKATAMLPAHMVVQNHHTEDASYINFTKIRNINTTFVEKQCRELRIRHGVFIDVFPLDDFTSNPIAKSWYKIQKKALMVRIAQALVWDKRPNPVKELLKKPLGWIWRDEKVAVEAREKLNRSFSNRDIWINHCGAYGDKEITPAQWYGEGCDLRFEGMTVKAPKEYDKLLTQLYGDYMQLPPEEKRVGHHYTAIFDLDKPYTEYYK